MCGRVRSGVQWRAQETRHATANGHWRWSHRRSISDLGAGGEDDSLSIAASASQSGEPRSAEKAPGSADPAEAAYRNAQKKQALRGTRVL
eukprot:1110127-Prorocentrum_minimum.AAC.6